MGMVGLTDLGMTVMFSRNGTGRTCHAGPHGEANGVSQEAKGSTIELPQSEFLLRGNIPVNKDTIYHPFSNL